MCDRERSYTHEHTDGPRWLGYALAGIAGTVFNAWAAEVRARGVLASWTQRVVADRRRVTRW